MAEPTTRRRPAELMVRNSERSCYKTCRQKWFWAYVLRLKPIAKRSPLEFGTYWHAILERRYPPGTRRHPDPHKIATVLARNYSNKRGEMLPKVKLSKDKFMEAEDLAHILIDVYLEAFGEDERYEVLKSEMTFQIDVTDTEGNYLFTAVGTADGLWRDLHTGRLLFLETKTGADLDPFGAPMEIDEQSGFYLTFGQLWLAEKKILKVGEEIDFAMFNRIKKALPDDRPKNEKGHSLNKDGSVSKQQPGPLVKRELSYRGPNDRINLMHRVAAEASEMQMARQGQLQIYKNPDRHCTWCEFKDMCEVHETGSDWKSMARGMYTRWEPYSAHEIKQERTH